LEFIGLMIFLCIIAFGIGIIYFLEEILKHLKRIDEKTKK